MTSPPNGKRRPAEAANPKSLTDSLQAIGDSSIATGRRYWARQLIERQTPERPQYGSTQWLMLPNDHPDKVAAAVIAAECWATIADTLEEDLRREIEAAQKAYKRAEDEAYKANYEAHKRRFPIARVVDSFSERRARQLEAAKVRPGDFMGRGEGA